MHTITPTGKETGILNRVRELMFRHGIKNLTMDDIAQNLGISKKTLYQIVDNKADLVNKILDLTLSEQKEGIQCIIESKENPIEELLDIYRKNSALARSMHYELTFELRRYYPESWEKLEDFRSEYIYGCIYRNLEKGIMQGLYRNDINIPILARLYSARVMDIFNPNMFPPKEFPVHTVLKEMFNYHVRGIASPAGICYLEEEVEVDL